MWSAITCLDCIYGVTYCGVTHTDLQHAKMLYVIICDNGLDNFVDKKYGKDQKNEKKTVEINIQAMKFFTMI